MCVYTGTVIIVIILFVVCYVYTCSSSSSSRVPCIRISRVTVSSSSSSSSLSVSPGNDSGGFDARHRHRRAAAKTFAKNSSSHDRDVRSDGRVSYFVASVRPRGQIRFGREIPDFDRRPAQPTTLIIMNILLPMKNMSTATDCA